MFLFAADNVPSFASLVTALSDHSNWLIVSEYGKEMTHMGFVAMVLRKQDGLHEADAREDGFRYCSGGFF
jgi:hypothetical protein